VRPVSRGQPEQRQDGLEEAEAVLRGVGRGLRDLASLQFGQEVCDRSDPRALHFIGAGGEGGESAEGLGPRPVGGSPACFPRSSPRDLGATRARLAREVAGQTRLPDPRFADKEHEGSVSSLRRVEGCAEFVELSLSSEQRL